MSEGKSNQVGFTGDELRTRLRAYDRTPFLDLLACFLECAPSAADIRMLARKSPDKYIQAITQLARTSGFSDKTESVNFSVHVTKLSDSQLEDHVKQLSERLALPSPEQALDDAQSSEYVEFEEVAVATEVAKP